RNPQIPYTWNELFARGKPRIYRGRQLDQIAFPLGGIGTGSIALGGWGQLRDFEIFNRPHKGLMFDYTFFTLHAKTADGYSSTRVVQGAVGGDNFTDDGSGVSKRLHGGGLPRFRFAAFEGAFPFARLHLHDTKMPLRVTLEAYNPFIPLNPDDSGLPIAIFHFTLYNHTEAPIEAVLFASMENKLGYPDVGGGVIEPYDGGRVRGLRMSTRKHPAVSPRYGTLALVTTHDEVQVQTHWYRGGWFDSLHRFWDLACEGRLDERTEPAYREQGTDVGCIALRTAVAPQEAVRLPVWIVWHIPNFEMYWSPAEPKPVWKNYYATRHADAVAVAEYVAEHLERLETDTRAFAHALWSSTLPEAVLDAVSSQISILKTTTCLRLPDGTFYGFEGCGVQHGCCEGTCTHVWNYAQALPYLFPSLERSVREKDYAINLHQDGHMTFRMPLPLGTIPEPAFHAAADGQMGGVLKVYRDWQICGDDEWLKSLWPSVKRALEYAWREWDQDKDGVMEGVQHNTYDIEFHGPNTMMGSFYLGALRAAEEMARHLGEHEKAEEYRKVYESGRAWMDANLFSGEYYIHEVRPASPEMCTDPQSPNFPKYQLGKGCLSDQLIGQWYARMLNLGDLFDPEHVRSAISSVFRYNWKSELWDHANPQRIYALNEEAGLLLASWPHGGRPLFPFPYSDEVWTGIEYQVASHLIYEGFLEEALAIVKGVRDRYNGERRNPWNEIECGNHYARAMASYALLLALAGFFYSAPKGLLRFAPRVYPDDFACFFSVDSGWGMVKQAFGAGYKRAEVQVHRGRLMLREVRLGFVLSQPRTYIAGRAVQAVEASLEDGGTGVAFAQPVTIQQGETLVIEG
ncbi:MAG: non-lysosomal glucosylceramidase, partial [bacterium]|nr:non-lysosomal glucosylceramidase [bacterium]